MSKIIKALKRTLGDTYTEPTVHFHQGTSDDFPEVCYEGTCQRPQLQA
jgi:hypothetical protein